MVSDPDQTLSEYHAAARRVLDTLGQTDRREANGSGSAVSGPRSSPVR
jgi:hypothetical protein